jgi:hypothetical protein
MDRRFGDDPRSGQPTDAFDTRQKLSDFMRIESSFDVSLKVSRSTTEQINVFASVLNLPLVGLVVMLPYRNAGG